MKKVFTNQRVALLCAAFFCALYASAIESAKFNFVINPWGLTAVESSDAADKGKIEDGFEIKQQDIVLTNQKLNDTYWNRLTTLGYKVYEKNKLIFTAPAGKLILRIYFYPLTAMKFDLTNDEGVEIDGPSPFDEDSKDDPYVCKVKGTKATFTGGSDETLLMQIEVVYKDDPSTNILSLEGFTTANPAVYSLDGIKVGTKATFDQLPKGIYVIDGKKVSKN